MPDSDSAQKISIDAPKISPGGAQKPSFGAILSKNVGKWRFSEVVIPGNPLFAFDLARKEFQPRFFPGNLSERPSGRRNKTKRAGGFI